jgi:hypothetical protein
VSEVAVLKVVSPAIDGPNLALVIRFEREGEERLARWVGGDEWRRRDVLHRLFAGGGVGGLRNSRCRATARRDGGLSGLGASVQILVSQPGIQNALRSKLSTAAAAEACGDTSAQNGILRAFRQQVEAQTGKAITETDVALLIAASESLMAD